MSITQFGGTTIPAAAAPQSRTAPLDPANPPPLPPDLTSAQQSALASIWTQLHLYGLDSLLEFARTEITAGVPPEQFALDLRTQPAFQARFGTVMDNLQAQGRPPMSVDQIMEYESQWVSIAKAGGLPDQMATREYAQRAIVGGNSIGEMQDRVQKGYVQVANNPTVAAAFRAFYPSDGLLASVFIDDGISEPELEHMVTAAQIGAEGQLQGFAIDRTIAERLSGLDVTNQQAKSAFDTLDKSRALFGETISESRDLQAEQEGVNAALGLDATSTALVTKRAQERQAAYQGSDQAQADKSGMSGLGAQRPH